MWPEPGGLRERGKSVVVHVVIHSVMARRGGEKRDMYKPKRSSPVERDVRVSSWSELHERLFENSWREPIGRFRSPFAFRGQPDAATDLSTSLCRMGGCYAEVEAHMLRAFRKYAGRDSVPGDSIW